MEHIARKFEKMGFPVEIIPDQDKSFRGGAPYRISVVKDHRGKERFKIDLKSGAELLVLDTKPSEKALVLMVKDDDTKVKMLLGHDERQLFVAAVPETVTTVLQAKDGLKPGEVHSAEAKAGVKKKRAHKHTNKARTRQGDFFFIPAPHKVIPENLILQDEPINRGAGASHMVEELYREGGVPVWVSRQYPNGISQDHYARLLNENPDAKRWTWNRRTRNARVFARGRITHGEHVTKVLKTWHEIIPNTEAAQNSFENMAFLD